MPSYSPSLPYHPVTPSYLAERTFIMFAQCCRPGPRCGCLAVLVAFLVLATDAPRAGAQFATAVATTGQIAPGTAGNSFSEFSAPVINGNGQVAFMGTMTGL